MTLTSSGRPAAGAARKPSAERPRTGVSVKTVRTMYPMSCHPTLCGMLVEVDEDQLLNVKGDPDNPDSQAWLSVHTRASLERDLRQPEQAAAPVGSGQAQRRFSASQPGRSTGSHHISDGGKRAASNGHFGRGLAPSRRTTAHASVRSCWPAWPTSMAASSGTRPCSVGVWALTVWA